MEGAEVERLPPFSCPIRNVVRDVVKLGAWTGAAAHWTRPAAVPGLAEAVLVQRPGGGPILTALRLN